MTRRRNTLRRRGGFAKFTRTHRRRGAGTTIQGNMPSSVKDGLRGTRLTGILRKDSEHWQPRKKANSIEMYQWSIHNKHGSHVPSARGTLKSVLSSLQSVFTSRAIPYRTMIRQTLQNANYLQELGYYIEDIHSSTSRPVYSKNGDDE